MKADSTTLAGLLTPAVCYTIPLFQRDYIWAAKDWETLWDDITELNDTKQVSRKHFMGAMVFVPEAMTPNKYPTFRVIDGQQRLITLSLVLCALRDVSSKLGFDGLANEITASYLIHQFKKDDEHFRVYPRWRDRDQYIAAVERKVIPGDTIRKALHYYTQQIEAVFLSPSEDQLRGFYNTLCNDLEFVQINLGIEENPFQIFRSLNSAGVDLAESDLIRNFMFMKINEKNQREFDKNYWEPLEGHFEDVKQKGKLDGKAFSAFLRDFLMHKGEYVGVSNTSVQFEAYCDSKDDVVEVVKELDDYVHLYDTIVGPKAHPSDDVKINDAIKQLRALESSTAYPIVLNLLNRVKSHTMSVNDATHAVRLLSGFILRRHVCNDSSRTYGKWFVLACAALKDSPLENLRNQLHMRGYPDDARFQEELLRFKLYQGKGNNTTALVVLKALEMSMPSKERADLSKVQIEHIMPQTLTQQWIGVLGSDAKSMHERLLHTIGNLTLTRYNQELAQKSFLDERKEYAKSGYQLTKAVAQMQPIWNENQIITRAKLLAERAKEIWIGPFA